MVEIAQRIVVDPTICFGRPTIRGTRVPVALVLAKLAGGITAASLQEEYHLQPEDIQAVLHYAAQLVAGEELIAEGAPGALFTLMDEMSREANQNGMTPEILDNILGEQMIIDLGNQEDRYGAAFERQLAMLGQGLELGSQGTASWTREDLHEH